MFLTPQFAVHIPAGRDAADLIASKHGFINIGQIGALDDHFLFEHPRIAKRSTDQSISHHQSFGQEPEVVWFEQQKELHRKKRDASSEINIPGMFGAARNVEGVFIHDVTESGGKVVILFLP